MLAEVGIGPFPAESMSDGLTRAALVLAAGAPAVGFICVVLVDGEAHIDQLSVLPDHGGRGTGRALLEAAIAWARASGLSGVTLTTFRDVPWNAPFYRRVGFVDVTDLPPGLAAVRAHERAVGDDDFGPRVAMRLAL